MALNSLRLHAEPSRGVFVRPKNPLMRTTGLPQSGRVDRKRVWLPTWCDKFRCVYYFCRQTGVRQWSRPEPARGVVILSLANFNAGDELHEFEA